MFSLAALFVVPNRKPRALSGLCVALVVTVALACGSDSTGPSFPTKTAATVALATGQQFSCALTTDGKSYCWGDNLRGQLGDSSFIPALVPTPTAGGHQFVAIAASYQTACALDRNGAAWCWGDDPTQPGVPLSFQTFPVEVSSPRGFKAITVGRKFACGLTTDGGAFCWGENGQGQLGVGDTVRRATATAVKTSVQFSSVVADFWSTCGLTAAGGAWCWGDNRFGELGTGDTVSSSIPRAVGGSQVFHQLSSGPIHECGLSSVGGAYCWGANSSGQLGDGSSITRLLPQQVIDGHVFTTIRSSRANSIFTTTCGVVASGDVYCWGYDSKGQLGTAVVPADPCLGGSSVCSYRPVKIANLSNVVALDVGLEHVCALTSGSQIFCWGDGGHGELGDGNGVASATPVQVKGGLPLP
jgi:alpha-tubulin suppressor-like RCC1 family protein